MILKNPIKNVQKIWPDFSKEGAQVLSKHMNNAQHH